MPKPLVLVPWGIILVLQGPWEYPTGHLGIQISIFIDFWLILGSPMGPILWSLSNLFTIGVTK